MFIDQEIQQAIVEGASERFGYPTSKIHLALIVGRFTYKDGRGEAKIRDYLGEMKVGGGPVRVHNVDEVATGLLEAVNKRDTYLDDPVVTTIRMLREAGKLSTAPT